MSDPSGIFPTSARTPKRKGRLTAVVLVLATVVMLALAYAVITRLDGDESGGESAADGGGVVPAEDVPSIEQLFTDGNCDSLDLSGFEDFAGQPLDEDPSPPAGWSRESETTGRLWCEYAIEYDEEENEQIVVHVGVSVFDGSAEVDSYIEELEQIEVAESESIKPLEDSEFTGVIIEEEHFGDDGMETDENEIIHDIDIIAARANIVIEARIAIEVGVYDIADGEAVLQALIEQAYAMCGYFVTE